jgi:hypothetical protein
MGEHVPETELSDIMYAFTRVASDFNKLKIVDGPENKKPPHLRLSKSEMIVAAIKTIADKKGSNKRTIRNYISENFKGDVKSVAFVHNELKRCVDKKILTEKKGSFRIANEDVWVKLCTKIDNIRAAGEVHNITTNSENVIIDENLATEQVITIETPNPTSLSPSKIMDLQAIAPLCSKAPNEDQRILDQELRLQKQSGQQWKFAFELAKRIETLEQDSKLKDNVVSEYKKVVAELQKDQIDMKIKIRVLEESKNAESTRLNQNLDLQHTKIIYLQKVVKDLKKKLHKKLGDNTSTQKKKVILDIANKEVSISTGGAQPPMFNKDINNNNIDKAIESHPTTITANASYDDRYHHQSSTENFQNKQNIILDENGGIPQSWSYLPLEEFDDPSRTSVPDWNKQLPLIESEGTTTATSGSSDDSEVETIE